MMRQNIFENRKRQTPKMTFVFVLKSPVKQEIFYCLHRCKYQFTDNLPFFTVNILRLSGKF